MSNKMKTMNNVFLYISLLCTGNVLSYCGNDMQIENLQSALIKHENRSEIQSLLKNPNPMTSAASKMAEVMTTVQLAYRLEKVFKMMQDSLIKNTPGYTRCYEIMDEALSATTVIKSTGVGLSLVGMIPGYYALSDLPSRLASSIKSIKLIKQYLQLWKKMKCKFVSDDDCNL